MEDEDIHTAALGAGEIKIAVAILDENDGILIQESFPPTAGRYETYLELYVQATKYPIHQTESQAKDFTGLGALLSGTVDNEEGILLYAPYADWKDVEVAGYLSKNLGISKVRRENDVNACAIGGKRLGPGNNHTNPIRTTMSTDVDDVVARGLKLVRGGPGFADELGHLEVEYKPPAHYPCSQYGRLEAHGSGTVLIWETGKCRPTSSAFAKALDGTGLKPDGAGCATLVRAGSMDTLDTSNQIGIYLECGISYRINILNIQAVVIGGEAVVPLSLLPPSIRVSVQQNTSKQMQDIDIVKTPLGYEAALPGMAALVLEQ